MKRKFITVSLTLVCFMLFSFIKANATKQIIQIEQNEGLVSSINAIKQQDAANVASDILLSSFIVYDKNGYPAKVDYPDEYGGDYIDENGKLVILLTSFTDDLMKKYSIILGEYDKCVDYQLAKNSYSSLLFAQDQITNEIATTLDGFCESYVDVKTGKILIGFSPKITENHIRACNDLAAKYGYEIEAVEAEEQIKRSTELKLGSAVNDGTYSYSIGACGTYQGSDAIITAGHISDYVPINGQICFGDTYVNSNKFGSLKLRQFNNNENGDFSIFHIGSTNQFRASHTVVNNTRLLKGWQYSPSVGATIYKYGDAGLYGYGSVTAKNLTLYYDGRYIKGLTKFSLSSGTVPSGDSGGACYIYKNSGYAFAGVIATSNSAMTIASFTPYLYINASGFSVFGYHQPDSSGWTITSSQHTCHCRLCNLSYNTSGPHVFINTYQNSNYHQGNYHYYLYADVCQFCNYTTNIAYVQYPCSGPPCQSEP